MRRAAWCLLSTLMVLLPAADAAAAELPDGTPIRVRLVQVITSETSAAGDSIEFVVTRDIVVSGEVVIPRGSRTLGVIVRARRLELGWITRAARLEFRFLQTTGRGGGAISLRSTPQARSDSLVVVDRARLHHQLQWADGADLFDAFVDGNHNL